MVDLRAGDLAQCNALLQCNAKTLAWDGRRDDLV